MRNRLFFVFLLFCISCKNDDQVTNKNQAYHNPGIVVSPLEAQQMLQNSSEDILLLDIRTEANYNNGHIDGAHQVWRSAWLTASEGGHYGAMRASRETMEKLLSELGVRNDTILLLYDDTALMDSTRLWWTLYNYSFDNIRMIDGGLQAWNAAELPLSRTPAPYRNPTDFRFTGQNRMDMIIDTDAVLGLKNNPGSILIDVRSRGEYLGNVKPSGARVSGRIPWSVWLEYKENVNYGNLKDWTFLPIDELKAKYEEIDATADKRIIIYCHSSIRAASTAFVLKELLGYPNVEIYDDAWLGWSYYNSIDPAKYDVTRGEG